MAQPLTMKKEQSLMRSVALFAICVLSFSALLFSQSENAKSKEKAEEVVKEWFSRWNDLDGSDQALDHFMELYHPDATQQVGPSERQIGPVLFQGSSAIRKMAADFSKTNTNLNYESQVRTVKEKTEPVFYVVEAVRGQPGVTGVATEFIGRYKVREGGKRYVLNGAAFFEIQAGKVRKLRLYTPREETEQIAPP